MDVPFDLRGALVKDIGALLADLLEQRKLGLAVRLLKLMLAGAAQERPGEEAEELGQIEVVKRLGFLAGLGVFLAVFKELAGRLVALVQVLGSRDAQGAVVCPRLRNGARLQRTRKDHNAVCSVAP